MKLNRQRPEKLLSDQWRRTFAILEFPRTWEAVEALAAALLQRITLAHDEIVEVLRPFALLVRITRPWQGEGIGQAMN